MARLILTDDQLAWLAANYRRPIVEIAQHLGCHQHTATRHLVRLGYISPNHVAAKFQPARSKPKNWTRPCLKCGDTKPRPKWLFLCDPCRERADEASPWED